MLKSDSKIPLIINTFLVRVRMRYDTYLFCKTSTYFSPCSSWCSAGHRTLTVKKATLFYCRWNWIHPLNQIANSVRFSISISSLMMQRLCIYKLRELVVLKPNQRQQKGAGFLYLSSFHGTGHRGMGKGSRAWLDGPIFHVRPPPPPSPPLTIHIPDGESGSGPPRLICILRDF